MLKIEFRKIVIKDKVPNTALVIYVIPTPITVSLEKGRKRLSILQALKYKLDRKSFQNIYFSFVRPVLEYADIVWDNCTSYEKEELEKLNVLVLAMRIVTGETIPASN